jgi:hypothetical protein
VFCLTIVANARNDHHTSRSLRNATAPNKMQAQQCGDVLAISFAFHIFAFACGEGGSFKITLLLPAQPLGAMPDLPKKLLQKLNFYPLEIVS